MMHFHLIGVVALIYSVFAGMEFNFHQNLFDLIPERVERIASNPETIADFEMKSFRTRDRGILFNFSATYLVDLVDIKIVSTVYQFLSNSYRLTNMVFVLSWCDCMKYNYIGMAAAKTTNGNFTDCPLAKNTYCVYNFKFDVTRFPPLIPEGKYKMLLNYSDGKSDRFLFTQAVYGSIVYKIGKKSKA